MSQDHLVSVDNSNPNPTNANTNTNANKQDSAFPSHAKGWSETPFGAAVVNFVIFAIPLIVNIVLSQESTTRDWLGSIHPIGITAFIFFVVNFVLYLWSRVIDRCWTVDMFWSIIPFILCWSYIVHPLTIDTANRARQAVVTSLVFVWGFRLSANFLYWGGIGHEDFRYVEMRKQFGNQFWWISYFSVFSGQGLFLYGLTLALYPSLTESTPFPQPLDIIAMILCPISIILETVSDYQMAKHRVSDRRGELMNHGCWRFSRHPNYLGEFLFWCSQTLFAIATRDTAVWAIAAPIAFFLMLRFASVPLIEKRMLGRRPAFAEYMKTTSAIFPLPQCACFAPK